METANRETLRGLCATCRNAPGCTFRQKVDAPVMECLEFDGEIRSDTPHPAGTAHRGLRNEKREPGLCGWCDNRATCTFPRSPGGTWFCEEYA